MQTQWLEPDNDSSAFLHVLRESIRMEQWSELAYRRRDFQGAQSGVDRKATLELTKRLGGLERYKLRTILCGAIRTDARFSKIDRELSPLCKCCAQQAVETTRHVFAECAAHRPMITQELTSEEWAMLPECLTLQGIMPRCSEQLPERFRVSPEDKMDLACIMQHNLLDAWDHRASLRQTPEPQPRWQRNQRPRLN